GPRRDPGHGGGPRARPRRHARDPARDGSARRQQCEPHRSVGRHHGARGRDDARRQRRAVRRRWPLGRPDAVDHPRRHHQHAADPARRRSVPRDVAPLQQHHRGVLMREYLVVFGVALAVTFLLASLARQSASILGAVARVRDRDVHAIPTPYFGGPAMLGGLLAAFLVATQLPFLSRGDETVFADARAVIVGGIIICL